MLIALTLLRLFSFVAYCIFYSTLTLFLLNQGMDKSVVVLYTASFLALHYFVTIIGGTFLRFVYDYRKLLIYSGILYFASAILFYAEHLTLLGLSAFVMGSLFFDSTYILLITRLFSNNKTLLQRGFFLGYLGMNLGGLIGFGLGGWLQKTGDTTPILLALLFCLVGTVLILVLTWRKWPLNDIMRGKSPWIRLALFFSYIGIAGLVYLLFHFQQIIDFVVIGAWWLIFIILSFIGFSGHTPERIGLRRLLQFVFIFMLFISLYYLIPTLIPFFLAQNVNSVLGGVYIPPAWFFNTMCVVVILAIFWNYKRVGKRTFDLYRQFRLGMILSFIAFGFLCVGAFMAGEHLIAATFALAYFIIQSLAEAAIAPISFTTVSEYILIEKHQPYYIGFWLSTYSVGMINAGVVSSKIVPHLTLTLTDNSFYAEFFAGAMLLALLGFGLAFVRIRKKGTE